MALCSRLGREESLAGRVGSLNMWAAPEQSFCPDQDFPLPAPALCRNTWAIIPIETSPKAWSTAAITNFRVYKRFTHCVILQICYYLFWVGIEAVRLCVFPAGEGCSSSTGKALAFDAIVLTQRPIIQSVLLLVLESKEFLFHHTESLIWWTDRRFKMWPFPSWSTQWMYYLLVFNSSTGRHVYSVRKVKQEDI